MTRKSRDQGGILSRAAVILPAGALLLAVILLVHGPSGQGPSAGLETGTAAPLETETAGAGAVFHGDFPEAGRFVTDPFCGECHSSPPHRGGGLGGSLLNHHSGRMHCLVCHGRGFFDAAGEIAWREGPEGVRALWPSPGGQPLETGLEREWREKALTGSACFSKGPGCLECHRKGGIFDYAGQGYDEKRIDHLQNLESFLTTSPGKRWFFPEVF